MLIREVAPMELRHSRGYLLSRHQTHFRTIQWTETVSCNSVYNS